MRASKTVARMPVGNHPLANCITIFHRRCTVVLCKPLKHVDKDNAWFAVAPLLESDTYPNRNGIDGDIVEGSIHGDDISPCFLVEDMFCRSCSVVIFVGTIGIVQYFVHNRWDWYKCV